MKDKGLIGLIAFLALVISIPTALITGWCLNVYKLTQCDFEPSYKEEIIRSIAIPVAPISWIVGYVDFEDEI